MHLRRRVRAEIVLDKFSCTPLESLIHARRVFYDANASPSTTIKSLDHNGIVDLR